MTNNRDLQKLSVLIADQNLHTQSIVKTLLKGIGIRNVRTANDAADAFAALQNTPVDLIIIDHVLATVDGIEFCRQVRRAKDSPNVYVPIIMLTSNTEHKFVMRARDAGVTEFLSKPVSAKTLNDRITTIMKNPRPFARSPRFFGPDRRRSYIEEFSGDEQRAGKAAEKTNDDAEVKKNLS